MAYTIQKKPEGTLETYVVKFDLEDRTFSRLMYEKRILNKDNMGPGCLSVKYSEKAYAFKLTYAPGSDSQKVMQKIKSKINVAALLMDGTGVGYNSKINDMFGDIFGGTYRK